MKIWFISLSIIKKRKIFIHAEESILALSGAKVAIGYAINLYLFKFIVSLVISRVFDTPNLHNPKLCNFKCIIFQKFEIGE